MRTLLLAVLAAVVLAGSTVAGAGENAPLRISWWGGAERHEATLAAARAFEKENPGVKISGEYTGWDGYLERLTMQLGANSEPDIIQIDAAWLTMFSKDGNGFQDLYALKDVIALDQFDKRFLAATEVNGKLNAIPNTWSGVCILWNKKTWDKAGVPLPKTWDDLAAAGKLFHERLGPDYYPIDLDWHEIVLMTHQYMFQKTGKQFISPKTNQIDFTPEETIEWMAFYKRLIDSGTIIPLSLRASLGGGQTTRQAHEFGEFIDGRWAGTQTYDGMFSVRVSNTDPEKCEWVLADYPTLVDAKCSGRIARPGTLWAISKNSKHQDMAAKFVNFMMCTEEGAKILGAVRGAPVAKVALETVTKNNLMPKINQEALQQIIFGETYLPSPYYEHVRIKDVFQQAIEGIGFGKMSPEEAGKLIYNDCQRQLQRLLR